MIIRECREEERQATIALINRVFRESENLKPTMQLEFPLLLGENNVDHMIIALEEDEVIGCVNYYISNIIIEGTSLKVASIGAVCTDERFRGKAIASKLLDYSENKMKSEGILFEIISGKRGLYLSRGASSIGKSYEFEINKIIGLKGTAFEFEEFKEENLEDIIALYNGETNRYYRSYEEFILFKQGATHNWGDFEFYTLCLKEENNIIAYVVVMVNKMTNKAIIKEFAGDRRALAYSLPKMYEALKVESINLFCPWNDIIVPMIKKQGLTYNEIDQYCSIKVLDYEAMMEKLIPYFSQYLNHEELQGLEFKKIGQNYIIKFKEEVIELKSIKEVNRLIFGSLDFNLMDLCDNNKKLYDVLSKVFPMPFVWMCNMNFI